MTVLLLSALFLTLAGAIGSQVLSGLNTTKSRLSTSTARYAAYAGLQHAVYLLRENPQHQGNLDYLMPGSDHVSYYVEVVNNYGDGSGTGPALNADDGTVVPSGSVYCCAMGVDDNEEGVALHAMSGLLSDNRPQLKYAAFSDSSVEMLGDSQSLSFNSSTTSFSGVDPADPASRALPDPATLGNSGDLGTNRYVTMDPTSTVSGDVYRPATTASSTVNLVSSLQAGAVHDLPMPVDIPKYSSPVEYNNAPNLNLNTSQTTPPTIPAPTANSPVRLYKKLDIDSGEKVRIGPGKYFFPEGLTIDGVLEATSAVDDQNPVIIFVGADAILGDGARVNLGARSANIQLYFVDNDSEDGQKFEMSGNSQFFGTVVGNRVKGALKDQAELYGGFLGRSMRAQGQSKLYFDEALDSNPLQLSANWGLNGVTEPKPEIVLHRFDFTNAYVTSVMNGTVSYTTAVGLPKHNTSM